MLAEAICSSYPLSQGPLKRISASFVQAFPRTTPTPAVVALNLKTGIALAITAAKWGLPDHDNSFRSYLIFHLRSCWGFDLHKKMLQTQHPS
jgi:hypothetical protein